MGDGMWECLRFGGGAAILELSRWGLGDLVGVGGLYII